MYHPMIDPKAVQAAPPLIIDRGEGVHVYDIDGKRYLDTVASLWNVNVGHNRPEVINAIKAQLDKLAYYSTFQNTSNPPAIELSARLMRLFAPENMRKVFSKSREPDHLDLFVSEWNRSLRRTESLLRDCALFVHGSTVATNTILEKKGAKVGMLTTEGFRDSLEIAWEHRFEQYDIYMERPDPLVLLAQIEGPGAAKMLHDLPPDAPEYALLVKEKLALEAAMARGGWGAPVAAAALAPGAEGDAVVALRDRLVAMGYLRASATAVYDRAVQAARRAFDGSWGKLSAAERGRLLMRLSHKLVEHEAELTALRERLLAAIRQHGQATDPVQYARRPLRQRVMEHVALGLMRLALLVQGKKYL